MVTLALMIIFGAIGSLIGNYGFDGAYFICGLIGAIFGLIVRLGGLGTISDIGDFGDY
jgi:hypothetical protein